MTITKDERTARERFESILREFKTGMLVTTSQQGPHARPMMVSKIDPGPTLWFITGADSAKVGEIYGDDRALLTMQTSGKYLSVLGRAEVMSDRDKTAELWSKPDNLWFDGPNDPKLVLLRFEPEAAEYWDSTGLQGLKFTLQAAKAYLKGERLPARDDVDQHAKIGL